MTTFRRKHLPSAQIIEVRGQPFFYVASWKRHPITGQSIPNKLAQVIPGQVLVAEFDPKSNQQTFFVYPNLAAVRAHFTGDDEDLSVTITPAPAPWTPAHHVGEYHDHSESLGSDDPHMRVLQGPTPS